MRYEPHGSVFGGYGFWSHGPAPSAQPAHVTRTPPPAPAASLSLRQLLARALSQWTRG